MFLHCVFSSMDIGKKIFFFKVWLIITIIQCKDNNHMYVEIIIRYEHIEDSWGQECS